MARIWYQRLVVFDQGRGGWHRWTSTARECAARECAAAHRERRVRRRRHIGTMNPTLEGRAAIDDLFERSFGPA